MNNDATSNARKRLVSLDGLRGIAALIVVIDHFCCAFLPRFIPILTNHPFWVVDTPLGILFNASFSVSIFFVLSGFVVARAAAKSTDPFYVNVPLRYVRLAAPVTVCVIFAWALLTVFPTAATRLDALHPSPWLRFTYQGHIPGIVAALGDGVFGTFRYGFTMFNNALWTMKPEAIGSMAIYLLYGLIKGRARIVVLIAIGIATTFSYPYYLGFVLGALIMSAWSSGKLKSGYGVASLAAGILVGFPGYGFAERMGIPHPWRLLTVGEPDGLIAQIAAALILYASVVSPSLDKLLSDRWVGYLGRVSFPLYLVHVPLLYTVFACLYVWIKPATPLFLGMLFPLFLITSLLLASAGEAWVDKPVLNGIAWARRRVRIIRRPAPSNAR